jgi:hypothetical protein
LIAGCSRSNIKIDDQTYIIIATNFSPDQDISLTIKTSLEPEKTATIGRNTTTKIYIRAAIGEYVQFAVSKITCIYQVTDSKGTRIADYTSLPSSTGNTIILDFIAFDPKESEKDFLQYKTGLAKSVATNLINKPYLLKERYFVENGIQRNKSAVQPSCSYDDEYRFIPYPGEFGNFNPERLIFTPVINKNQSSCSYGASEIIPTNAVSVINNNTNTMNFPIWDLTSIDGAGSSMIYRQLFIDAISTDGFLTLHRDVTNSQKEVFVYKPK